MARREEQGRLRPSGAESKRRERNSRRWSYRTATDHMDDGCGPESVRRIDMDPHRAFKTCSPGSEIATGGAYPGMWKPAVARTPRSWRWPIRRRPRRHWLRICSDFAGFGRKMKHRTFLNLSALKFPTILVSGGRRGSSIVIGSRNCWRRSGSDHRYRKHQPASEWLLPADGADEISAGKKHAAVVVTERNGQRNGKWGGGQRHRCFSPRLPVGLGAKTELSPLIPR